MRFRKNRCKNFVQVQHSSWRFSPLGAARRKEKKRSLNIEHASWKCPRVMKNVYYQGTIFHLSHTRLGCEICTRIKMPAIGLNRRACIFTIARGTIVYNVKTINYNKWPLIIAAFVGHWFRLRVCNYRFPIRFLWRVFLSLCHSMARRVHKRVVWIGEKFYLFELPFSYIILRPRLIRNSQEAIFRSTCSRNLWKTHLRLSRRLYVANPFYYGLRKRSMSSSYFPSILLT